MTDRPTHAHVLISPLAAEYMGLWPEFREALERQGLRMADRRGWVPPFCIHVTECPS